MRFRLVQSLLNAPVVLALAVTCCVAWLSGPPMEAANVSKQQADVFARKLTQIATPQSAGTRRTPITEGEVNSWFVYHAPGLLPAGVSAPEVTIVGNGKVAGQAIVDLDAVARRRASGGMLDPWSYLTGKVPVHVTGSVTAANGIGRFDMESAEISGIPVPKTLLQQLVGYYSRSAARPGGINLDEAFPLPANIQKIEVGQGQAVVVQ